MSQLTATSMPLCRQQAVGGLSIVFNTVYLTLINRWAKADWSWIPAKPSSRLGFIVIVDQSYDERHCSGTLGHLGVRTSQGSWRDLRSTNDYDRSRLICLLSHCLFPATTDQNDRTLTNRWHEGHADPLLHLQQAGILLQLLNWIDQHQIRRLQPSQNGSSEQSADTVTCDLPLSAVICCSNTNCTAHIHKIWWPNICCNYSKTVAFWFMWLIYGSFCVTLATAHLRHLWSVCWF